APAPPVRRHSSANPPYPPESPGAFPDRVAAASGGMQLTTRSSCQCQRILSLARLWRGAMRFPGWLPPYNLRSPVAATVGMRAPTPFEVACSAGPPSCPLAPTRAASRRGHHPRSGHVWGCPSVRSAGRRLSRRKQCVKGIDIHRDVEETGGSDIV